MQNLYRETCDHWKVFRKSKSGQRFQELYHCRKQNDGNKFCLKKCLSWGVGLILIIVGLAIGWLPGPGGFVGIIGLAIIARQSLWVARWMDFGERKLMQIYHWGLERFSPSQEAPKS